MGWTACLPVICVSTTSLHISHKTTQAFEEKSVSMETLKSLSAFEICGYKNDKSNIEISSFMCDYCAHTSESKSSLFEHFVKNHVFLCTMCSYIGLKRSSVLKHCLETHTNVMEEKMKDMRIFNLNLGKLSAELDYFSKGFKDFHNSSGSNLLSTGYSNSSDEISKSSLHGKDGPKSKWNYVLSSDGDSDFEYEASNSNHRKKRSKRSSNFYQDRSKEEKADAYHDMESDRFGAKSEENLAHFLDGNKSPRNSLHDVDDYSEFSDSNQMDLFFSSEGNDKDQDLSESIFHDHKEMFMVSRLPFPIRQDDSPNDPFNNPAPQLEPSSSILQSILQKDKKESGDSRSSTSTILSSEKHCVPNSIVSSPLPSEEHLKKHPRVEFPQSSSFVGSDNESLETKEANVDQQIKKEFVQSSDQPVESEFLQSSRQNDIGDAPAVANKDIFEADKNSAIEECVETVNPSCVTVKIEPDNFLLPTNPEEGENVDQENPREEPGENTELEDEKFTLLRNLLKEKHTSDDLEKMDTSHDVTSNENSNQAPDFLRTASDMSLLELLSMDTPFPLSPATTKIDLPKNMEEDSSIQALATMIHSCNICKQTFPNKYLLDSHIKMCMKGKHPLIHLKESKSNEHSLPSSHSFHSTTSKGLSRASENDEESGCEMTSVTKPVWNSPVCDSTRMKQKLQIHGEFSESFRHSNARLHNLIGVKFQSRHEHLYRNPDKSKEAIGKEQILRGKKRTHEEDKDYDPESESSESSDSELTEPLVNRKKAKRIRKYFVSARYSTLDIPSRKKSKPEVPSAVSLMSKLCERALSAQCSSISSEPSNLSSFSNSSLSLSSSSSSSKSLLSSSSSLLSISGPSVAGKDVDKGKREIFKSATPQSKDNVLISEQCSNLETTKAASSTLTKPEFGTADQNKEKKDHFTPQTVSELSVSGVDVREGPPQTLLHHLLKMPSKVFDNQIERRNITCKSSNVSVSEIDSHKEDCYCSWESSICKDLQENPSTSITEGKQVSPEDVNTANDESFVNGKKTHSGLDSSLSDLKHQRSGKIPRKRAQSFQESDFTAGKFLKERQTCHTSRLSASMMDIPDPPMSSSLAHSPIIKPPQLPSFLPPISPTQPPQTLQRDAISISISDNSYLNRDEKQNVTDPSQPNRSKLGQDVFSYSSDTPVLSTAATNLPPLGSLPGSSSSSSLLRNLLTQRSEAKENS